MCNFRPATREDFEHFYGYPPQHSFTGVVGELDEELIGIGGVALVHINGRLVSQAFMKLTPQAEARKRDLVRGTRLFLAKMHAEHRLVYAQPDSKYSSSAAFLTHFGFVPVPGAEPELHVWRSNF